MYFDNDDNNLETLKGKKRTEVGFVLAIFDFGGRRTNRCAILTYCSFRKKDLHILKFIFAIQLMMKYGLSSRPTSSIRHINEINHKRGLTHFEKMF